MTAFALTALANDRDLNAGRVWRMASDFLSHFFLYGVCNGYGSMME